MARIRLTGSDEFEVAADSRDIRGERLRDETGNEIGRIDDLIADTEAMKVDAAVLENGREIPIGAISLAGGRITLRDSSLPGSGGYACTIIRRSHVYSP